MEKRNQKIKFIVYRIVSRLGISLLRRLFPEYFAKEPLAPTDRYIEYPFIIRNLPKPPAKVLDVGCSGSFFPLLLASFGYDTYGIDIRNYPILNKLKFKNFTFVKGDIKETPFPNSYFDVITAISTIEHIGISGRYGIEDDPEGDKKALEEMVRILKPQGTILLTIPFGKGKVIKPYMRVYDDVRIKNLIKGCIIEAEEYCMQDERDNWMKCSKEECSKVNITPDRYPLCLLNLKKDSIFYLKGGVV